MHRCTRRVGLVSLKFSLCLVSNAVDTDSLPAVNIGDLSDVASFYNTRWCSHFCT